MAAPATSITSLIVADIKAALAQITTGNGYATTLAEIVEGRLSPLETHLFPYVSLIPASDPMERAPQTARRSFDCTLHVWIDAPAAMAGDVLREAIADILEAMQVDTRRGGYADATLEGPTTAIYTVATERLRGAEIAFSIPYRTSLRSPRQAV